MIVWTHARHHIILERRAATAAIRILLIFISSHQHSTNSSSHHHHPRFSYHHRSNNNNNGSPILGIVTVLEPWPGATVLLLLRVVSVLPHALVSLSPLPLASCCSSRTVAAEEREPPAVWTYAAAERTAQ